MIYKGNRNRGSFNRGPTVCPVTFGRCNRLMIFNPFLPRAEARVLQCVQPFESVDEILKFEPFKRFWIFTNLAFSQTKRKLKKRSYPAKFKKCCLKARICKTKPREDQGTKHSIGATRSRNHAHAFSARLEPARRKLAFMYAKLIFKIIAVCCPSVAF